LRKKLPPKSKPGLHPKNRHSGRYDFAALLRADPALARFVLRAPNQELSIDFADPKAVLALNRALLMHMYGLRDWFLPPGYLCPPIPGRADYVHHLASLIAEQANVARVAPIRILDIGTGANCIYPIIAAYEYGWTAVGSDIDVAALRNAEQILKANPQLQGMLELRQQRVPARIFSGVVRADERFAACICNPPFHTSARAAAAGSARKVLNLTGASSPQPTLNFGGQAGELWCAGGELGFIKRMIGESAEHTKLCEWFSVLLSKQAHLSQIKQALVQVNVAEYRVVAMCVGQKQSRFVAWRF
jgi:23S rRNA (adenine1618-N6)-methyltransferase